jgi:hypothetical protein
MSTGGGLRNRGPYVWRAVDQAASLILQAEGVVYPGVRHPWLDGGRRSAPGDESTTDWATILPFLVEVDHMAISIAQITTIL